MEKELIIKSHDGLNIYGTFSSSKQKTKCLVIFVHGFTGNKDEHIFFNGTKFFSERGFDTYRFNLYASDGKNSRHFRDVSISQHGKDINTIVGKFRSQYKKIYLVGHSYGGTSLLFVKPDKIDAIVFWDASYIDKNEESKREMKYNANLDAFIIDWGIEMIVGKKFVNELNDFPDCGELIKKLNKPLLFIAAGRKGNLKAGMKYVKATDDRMKLINIETADHNFNNWKDEEELFNETYGWLNSI